MSKHFFISIAIAILITTGVWSGSVRAESGENICDVGNTKIVFGYFNGVNTTETLAHDALEKLKSLYGVTLPTTGEQIRYENFYNKSQGLTVDVIEVADQRFREQNELLADRFELFWEGIDGADDWWETITNGVTGAAEVFDAFIQDIQAAWANGLGKLVQAFTESPTDQVTYAEHRGRIDTLVLEGKKLVFLAHSQGNLYVNRAADYARSLSDENTVKVVHVAPASPSLRGEYILADKDLVINALRAVGSVPSNTHTIPFDRPVGLGGETDPLGHGLLAIYLNPHLSPRPDIDRLVQAALNEVVAPQARASDGFFTVTLTWDGGGDVDLHTFEPQGSHVYFAHRRGMAGYLDVDNTRAYGPEHYYASCNAGSLQTGTYQIRIANYARAQGRTATVQLSTAQDGVIHTAKPVLLGNPTWTDPVYPIFNVVVSHDEATNKYNVDYVKAQ